MTRLRLYVRPFFAASFTRLLVAEDRNAVESYLSKTFLSVKNFAHWRCFRRYAIHKDRMMINQHLRILDLSFFISSDTTDLKNVV